MKGYPKRAGHRLTAEAEAEYHEWSVDSDCSCHLPPPCHWCTHTGHPLNLECTDEAWELDAPEPVPLHRMLEEWK